ncbi:C39 family peptidase [Patescibacteria group bacterium]|nr:C39 family peptidase [Patescibacteria group bacterium]
MKKRNLVIFVLLAGGLVGSLIFYLPKYRQKQTVYQSSEKLMTASPTPTVNPKQTNPPQAPTATPVLPTPTSQPALVFTHHSVPFTSQAPFAEWDQTLFQDGCEEASVLMAISWAKNEPLGTPQEIKEKLLTMFDWEETTYGVAHDTSAADTADRLIKTYLQWPQVEARAITSPQQIAQEVVNGNLVITPMDGQKLNNPNFTDPGPERHMLVIIGYDPQKLEFITNDPGTRHGKDYRYPISVFWEAVRDYPTGDHEPIEKVEKEMIVINR